MLFQPRTSTRLCQSLLFLVPVLSCAAGSFPRLSLGDLVSQSDIIVSGTVKRSHCAWDSEHRFIWTHTELAVAGRMKGTTKSVVTISEPGGTVDGLTMQIPGSTTYAPGERVTVFLYRTPLGSMRTTGYGQGKFIVSPDGRVHSVAQAAASVEALDGLTPSEFRARIDALVAK